MVRPLTNPPCDLLVIDGASCAMGWPERTLSCSRPQGSQCPGAVSVITVIELRERVDGPV